MLYCDHEDAIRSCKTEPEITAASTAVMLDDELTPHDRTELLSISWSRRSDLRILTSARKKATQTTGKQFNIKRKAAQRA